MAQRTWTTRQREVLDLLAAGKTNHEIAVALGITFDGAKWHVSEIMGHLGVDSREDAAEYWRREQGIPSRFARLRRAILGGTVAKVAAGVGVLGLAGVAGLVLLNLPGDDDAEPGPTPLTRGENYSYTPALAYLKPDGTVDIVEGDGIVRTANYLDGCDPYSHPGVEDEVVSGIQWSMNGDRLACITDAGEIRTSWPGRGATAVFFSGTCAAFAPGLSPDGTRIGCVRDAGLSDLVEIHDGQSEEQFRASLIFDADWSSGSQYIVLLRLRTSAEPFSYEVRTPDGDVIGSFANGADEFLSTHRLVWNKEGDRAVFASDQGIRLLDLQSGWDLKTLRPKGKATLRLSWHLDDTAVLVWPPAELIDIDSGESLPLPSMDAISFTRGAPNGRDLAMVQNTGSAETIVILNLENHETHTIPGISVPVSQYYFESGIEDIFWSGDSRRICWQYREAPSLVEGLACTDVSGGPIVEVAARGEFTEEKPQENGRPARVQALSPDLARLAYTLPGPSEPGSPQVLWISDPDGGNAIRIGEVAVASGFVWQPDAVWRPLHIR